MKNPMKPEQIALPLGLINGDTSKKRRANTGRQPNADLIGCSFNDGAATITVTSVCHANPNQVMVTRDLDGKSWSAPVWLIRVVVGQKKRRRAA